VSSNLAQVAKDIYSQIEALWAELTPIGWPNVSFVHPTNEPWIEVSISWGDGAAVSMAPTNRNTLVGVLFINCYCVENEGQGELMGIVDAARDLFNRATLGTIRFDVPSAPKPVNGMFNQVTVTVSFTVDETV
jgi:hypothetical protein